MFDHISQPHPAAQANAHADTLAQAKTTTAGKFRSALHTFAHICTPALITKIFSNAKNNVKFLKNHEPAFFQCAGLQLHPTPVNAIGV